MKQKDEKIVVSAKTDDAMPHDVLLKRRALNDLASDGASELRKDLLQKAMDSEPSAKKLPDALLKDWRERASLDELN